MADLFWLKDTQMECLRQFFPKPRGRARVDDRRVLSGIIFVNRNGLRWRDAPSVYGPSKTLYNRWLRWSRMGVFARMLIELAAQGQKAGLCQTNQMRVASIALPFNLPGMGST